MKTVFTFDRMLDGIDKVEVLPFCGVCGKKLEGKCVVRISSVESKAFITLSVDKCKHQLGAQG